MKFNSFLPAMQLLALGALGALVIAPLTVQAQPDPNYSSHDRTQPLPPVIVPGTASTQEQPGRPPSDAVILFDGKSIANWVSMDGSPTRWIVKEGYMECVKGSGYVRTLENFGDCQLHIEWAAPLPVEGEGQGRGNSGVFFGLDRYEVQVLDSFENETYADGSAGAIYGQYPPLVNAARPPGQWQSYDIIYTAPRFSADGTLLAPVSMTVFHNGVLIQNSAQLTGPTAWLERAAYRPHPEKQPIALQDHGNPVRFRNIWVRPLGQPGKREFTLARALLDRYAGVYERSPGNTFEISRNGNQLGVSLFGVKFDLFAESPTKFFAKPTDVQFEFESDAEGKVDRVVWSVGEGANVSKRVR
jgi:hypothetical protein